MDTANHRLQRNHILFTLLIIVTIAVVVFTIMRLTSLHDGHSLEYWVLALDNVDDPETANRAEAVVKRVGPTVLPKLVEFIQCSESPLVRAIDSVRARIPPRSPPSNRESRIRFAAVSAFRILGSTGQPAMGQLEAILIGSDLAAGIDKKLAAAQSMAGIGTPAIPLLQKALTADKKSTQMAALVGLADLGFAATECAPQVSRLARHDDDAETREWAITCWSSIVTNVNEKLPLLLEALYDPDSRVAKTAEHYITRAGPLAIPYVMAHSDAPVALMLSNKIRSFTKTELR